MFDKVMTWLERDMRNNGSGFSDADMRVAVAALLHRMILADGVIIDAEVEQLRSALQEQFGVDAATTEALFDEGKRANGGSASLFPFTFILNRSLDREGREAILRELSEVAESDGNVHPLEESMIDQIRTLLEL